MKLSEADISTHLNLVDLHNPRLEGFVLQGFPLKDLKPRRKLWFTLVAEQPAQVSEKEPGENFCWFSKRTRFDKPLVEKDEAAVGDAVIHDRPAHSVEEGDAVLVDVGGVEVPEQGGVLAAVHILGNLVSLQPVQSELQKWEFCGNMMIGEVTS